MDTALDDIAFLANSDNRVAAFELLVGGSRDRDELTDRVDASRVTVTRILREFEAREWVTRSGQEYAVTPDILETIRDHRLTARRFREMLNEPNARYFAYEEIPVSVGIVNGAVGINLTDEQGTLKGGLQTNNETIHEWAVDLFETCRERARPVEPDATVV